MTPSRYLFLSLMLSYHTEAEVGSGLDSVSGHVSVVILSGSMSNVIRVLSLQWRDILQASRPYMLRKKVDDMMLLSASSCFNLKCRDDDACDVRLGDREPVVWPEREVAVYVRWRGPIAKMGRRMVKVLSVGGGRSIRTRVVRFRSTACLASRTRPPPSLPHSL